MKPPQEKSPKSSAGSPHRDPEPTRGRRTPHGVLSEFEPPTRRSRTRLALQIFGVALSLALLVWSTTQALTPENQQSLERLRHAHPGPVAALVALVLASVALNGLIFHVILTHTHRLGAVYLAAVTGIATLLAYAPFKLSLLSRVFIHRRRDRLRYRTLIAWLAAVGGLSVCVLAPATLASLWHPSLDAWWALGALGAPAAMLALAVLVARRVRTIPALHTATLGSAEYAVSATRVATLGALRTADLASMALRFGIAASILGIDIAPGEAMAAASVYFLTGVLSPSGNLGAREGAVTGLGLLPAVGNHEELALLALTVTGAEIVGALIAGVAGAVYVRPDRLLAAQPPAFDDSRRSVDVPSRDDFCD